MNRIHRKIWNARLGAFVAVAETAKGRVKASGGGMVGSVVIGLAALGTAQAQNIAANALPTGGQVTAGSITYGVTGNTLNVNQTSQRGAINWNSFNVGSGATVNFNQLNAQSITLNRVVGNERSVIDGAINANGQVWVLNAAGALVGRNAQINTAGLLLSTLNISDADFMAGRSTFESTGGSGRIVNFGTINAAGGYVALLGQQVVNEGLISARLGTAVLAAGDKVSLNFNGDSLVSATVDRGVLDALVSNKQAILADGGLVMLTAKGLDQVLATVVNNTGEIRAQTVAEKAGRIYLLGGMENERVAVGGTLDASAPDGGRGGFIETSAARVSIADDATITARSATGAHGQWLIDPNDFTIAASGGDMTGATVSAALANANVTILSVSGATSGNGDIFVNDNIAKTAGGDTTLTLQADRNIIIGADTSISSTSGKLNVHLSANNAGGGATIDLLERSSITTNGGNVIFGGALTAGQPATDRTVDVRINPNDNADGATINAGGGDVRFYAKDMTLGQYAKITAGNILAQLQSLDTGNRAGIKWTAATGIDITATGQVSFRGRFSPPAGSASITLASQSGLYAGEHIALSGDSINLSGAALKLSGTGSNTLTMSSMNGIEVSNTSFGFMGTPHLSIALQQGHTQSAVHDMDDQYTTLAGYLAGAEKSLYEFAVDNAGLSLYGTHFGIKGAAYSLKIYSDTNAQTVAPKSLDNGKLAFGTGLQDSVNNLGNLYQPFYYDTDLDRWFKLTYSTYPLDIAIGVGGDGSAGWNTNGEIISSDGGTVNLESVISNVTLDTSQLSGGIGRIIVNYTVTVPNGLGTFTLSNNYSLGAGDSFIKTITTVTNTSVSPLDNVRLWLGTRDDYIAISDSNFKTKGNITENGFTPITSQDEQAKSILISEFNPAVSGSTGSAILFHSTNSDADTITDSCCDFSNITNKDPRTSEIVTLREDGSYGLFMNFTTLPTGAAKGVTWYYGATSLSNINSLVNQVITGGALEPDLPVVLPAPPTNPRLDQAVANATNAVNPPLPGTPNLNIGAPLGGSANNPVPNVVTVPSGVSLQFAPNEALMIVSSLDGDVPNNPVSLSQARQMMGGGSGSGSGEGASGGSSSAGGNAGGSANANTGASSQDGQGDGEQSTEDGGRTVAVPASRNSMVQIVNGGVRLPGGVEQQLFVVKK